MSRPIMPPVMPRRPAEVEESAKLGAPGEPAGDAGAIVDQQAAVDGRTAGHRAKLTRAASEVSSQSDLEVQNDLVDKAPPETVDNLTK